MNEIIKNMPYIEYRKNPAVSNSDLIHMGKSPAHFKWNRENPREDTDALLFGRAIHKLLLEPDDFNNDFIFAPDIDKRSKDGKKEWESFNAEIGSKEILSIKVKDQLYNTVESIRSNEMVRKILNLKSDKEVSMFWTDKETGVDCKARTDIMIQSHNIIADIKSTRNAGIEDFSKSAWDYGYYTQSPFYSDGYETILGEQPEFYFIAFEKEPPYGVMLYRADERMKMAGQEIYRRRLERYKKCAETNIWENYPQQVYDLDIPEWAYNRIKNSTGIQF